MLAARRLGMPETAVQTHASVLHHMQYTMKTMFGISDNFIQHIASAPLFGTGQGSGASPAVWLTLSIALLSALKKLIPRGMYFQTLSGSISVERFSDVFVGDAQNGTNDAHLPEPVSLPAIIGNLEAMSQSPWEKLLFCSGGALELSKCFYYIIYWKLIDGLPTMLTIPEMKILLASN